MKIAATRNKALKISDDASPADAWVRRHLAGGLMNSNIIHFFACFVCLLVLVYWKDEKEKQKPNETHECPRMLPSAATFNVSIVFVSIYLLCDKVEFSSSEAPNFEFDMIDL